MVGEEHGLLRGEHPEERRPADAGQGCDLVDRGLLEALFAEQREGGVDHPCTGVRLRHLRLLLVVACSVLACAARQARSSESKRTPGPRPEHARCGASHVPGTARYGVPC